MLLAGEVKPSLMIKRLKPFDKLRERSQTNSTFAEFVGVLVKLLLTPVALNVTKARCFVTTYLLQNSNMVLYTIDNNYHY